MYIPPNIKPIMCSVGEYTGKDLLDVRKKMDLTVWDMAYLLDISRTSLWRIENKKADEYLPLPLCLTIQHLKTFFQ